MSSGNNNPCGGPDNEGNGCFKYFPRMPLSQVLCGRCKKLNEPNLSDMDREKIITAYQQCLSCGVCGHAVKNPCGTCRRHDIKEQGTVDTVRAIAAEERHQKAQRSFGKERPPVPLFNSSQPSSGTGSFSIGATTALAEIEMSKSTTAKGVWSIIYSVRRAKGTIDKQLGSGIQTFPGDTTMPSVLETLVKLVNSAWTRQENNTLDLSVFECELRFTGNFVFSPEAQTLSIKDFYNFYLNNANKHLLCPPKARLPMGSFIAVELFINDIAYKSRLAEAEGYISLASSIRSKRRTNENLQEASASLSSTIKRRRSGTVGPSPSRVLVSSFQLSPATTAQIKESIVQTITITFTTITCQVDAITGSSQIKETNTKRTGKLEKKELQLSANDQGRSKHLTIEDKNKAYVAKRFMDSIAKQTGTDMNLNYLLYELVRVKRLESFQALFAANAHSKAVEVASFTVTDAFIILLDDDSSSGCECFAYIVEPLRATTSTTKFSGTFGANRRKDKLSATISAFAHYVAESTACKLVFADLQGSMHYQPGKQQRLVLFDPMTHSPHEGGSGIGDFGVPGIQDFIDSHECTITCVNLALASKDVLNDTLASLVSNIEEAKKNGEDIHTQEPITIYQPSLALDSLTPDLTPDQSGSGSELNQDKLTQNKSKTPKAAQPTPNPADPGLGLGLGLKEKDLEELLATVKTVIGKQKVQSQLQA